jgi:hypothetical protein
MSKLLAGIIAALLVGVGVAAASSLTTRNDDPVPTSSISTLDSTASTGPAESTGTTETTPTTSTETGEDVSGPCDEAEHANDPRCTGGATTTDDDRRGRGRDDDDDDRADNHGGRGRDHAEDDGGGADDHSGRGRGGDDGEERSGSNSGSGSDD